MREELGDEGRAGQQVLEVVEGEELLARLEEFGERFGRRRYA